MGHARELTHAQRADGAAACVDDGEGRVAVAGEVLPGGVSQRSRPRANRRGAGAARACVGRADPRRGTSRLVAIERDLVSFRFLTTSRSPDERFALAALAPRLYELAECGARAEMPESARLRAWMLLEALRDFSATTAERFHERPGHSTTEALAAYAHDRVRPRRLCVARHAQFTRLRGSRRSRRAHTVFEQILRAPAPNNNWAAQGRAGQKEECVYVQLRSLVVVPREHLMFDGRCACSRVKRYRLAVSASAKSQGMDSCSG